MSRCPCCEDAHPQETPTYLLASQLGKGCCGPHMDLEEVTSLPQPSALLCIKWRGLSLLLLLSLILDGGLHEHEDFYRLCSVCEGNITFEPLLPRLPALERETQTPAPTMHPKKDRFEHEALKHVSTCAQGGSAGSPVVPLPTVSSRAVGSSICFLALVLRCPYIQQTLKLCTQDPQFCPSPRARHLSQATAAPVNL